MKVGCRTLVRTTYGFRSIVSWATTVRSLPHCGNRAPVYELTMHNSARSIYSESIMPKATATNFSAFSAFEKQKWADEKRLKERELELKQREVDKSVWSNPLFLAICAAIVTATASIYVASDNSKRQHELELVKAEQGRILEAIRTGNPDRAAENLKFMLEVGLIGTPEIAEKLRLALSTRTPGTGPSLPSRSANGWEEFKYEEYRGGVGYNGYKNPSIDYVDTSCSKVDGKCQGAKSQSSTNDRLAPGR